MFIRSGVLDHFAWNLTIGEQTGTGEQSWCIDHAPIEIGTNACISQNAMICSIGHDCKLKSPEYRNKSNTIRNGAWRCLMANVLAGSEIGNISMVSAGKTFVGNLPDGHMYVSRRFKSINYSN